MHIESWKILHGVSDSENSRKMLRNFWEDSDDDRLGRFLLFGGPAAHFWSSVFDFSSPHVHYRVRNFTENSSPQMPVLQCTSHLHPTDERVFCSFFKSFSQISVLFFTLFCLFLLRITTLREVRFDRDDITRKWWKWRLNCRWDHCDNLGFSHRLMFST